MSRILAAVIAIAVAPVVAPVAAQAPRVTPAGDPSVNADTIYRLAIDPKDRPEETSLFLLDDGIVRLEADGTGARTYRQIVQILRPEAAENYQEMRFSYAPRHERFTLNWIRVVRPDGTVISEKPSQVQESDVPAQMGDPIYSDRKVIRASVTGVAPGTIVDFSYTTEELKPFLAGDAYFGWSVSTGGSVARSRYIVDVPADLRLNIRERNLTFRRAEHASAGRRTLTWAIGDLPKVKPEPFAADSNDVHMSVDIGLPLSWSDIGKWYAGHASSRYALTPAVEAKLSELIAGARTLDDTLRAIHRWVAQDVRYVSIALGLGGYQPRTPDDVLRSGFGDCKDKATIFVAMLQRLGIDAQPVLLNSTGGVARGLPSIKQFDHAIAAFRRPGRREYEFTDLTAKMTPLGELPFGMQGEFGIVVHRDGRTEEVTFPKSDVRDNRAVIRVSGTLSEDGSFSGDYEERAVGARQYGLRDAFFDPPDSTQRSQMANGVASQWFQAATGEYVELFDGRDLARPPRVTLRVKEGRAAQVAGNTVVLQNPFGDMTRFTAAARELEAEPPRRFPIDAGAIFGHSETHLELRVTLPEGWRAQLPAGVEATGPFGSYRSTYEQNGRELVLTRTVTGASGILPPDRIGALIAWMRDIGRDGAGVIVIQKDGGRDD
jgi:hypothetical protein